MQKAKGSVEAELQDLLKKDPGDILNNLIEGKISIIALLNSQTLSAKQLMGNITLIHKACAPTNDVNLVAILLCKLASCNDSFITAVSVLAGKKLANIEAIENDFLETVLDMIQMLVQRVPTASINILQILLPQLSEVCRKCGNDEHMLDKLEELEKQKEACIAVFKNAETSAENIAAPCDFRLLPNIPSYEEMFLDKPFLRPAITDGPFNNVQQYLDIHFRLMREDMFRDFRKCLSDVHCHKKLENGRLYQNAYIDKIEQTPKGKLFRLAVPVRSKVEWRKTKRLGPGSLLCLSCDGFRRFHFASIYLRKDDGKNGNICYLDLLFDAANEPIHFFTFYDVIEAGGYYESCRHIFENLKKCKASTFPFETCLLDYKDCNDIPFPLNPEQEIHLNEFQVKIKDENQNRAFELALRNKIALIQGPPGTGKSYLGVQIAQYLTQIANIRKPVIVICYTNHALDQFLEKMLDFTTKVVRIGGRSKNEKLKEYNLNSLRRSDENLNRLYGDVKGDSEIISQYLDSRMMTMTFPFIKTTMDLRLCDIHRLHEVLANSKLKGNIFDTVLHTSDNIKLYHWLMTDKSFSNIYDGMVDFKKFLTEELCDAFQLKGILEKEKREKNPSPELDRLPTSSELGHLPNLLIRLCVNDKPNSYFNKYKAIREDIEIFIRTYLTSDKDVFLLFYHAAVRCCEKNRTIVNEQCNDLWMLDLNERWKLLSIILFEVSSMNTNAELLWKKFTIQESGKNRRRLADQTPESFRIETFEKNCTNLHLRQTKHDARFLQDKDFIGLTTTGAAKNFDLLKEIQPTTYIVEEAAEVFESHIVAALVPNIEHLILIGDHFQLRPSPTVYDLAVKYHLDVSLFERLFKNGVPSECLKVQHRMRPAIATLMVPEFYRSLANHPSVLEYENVAGVSSNVFFLSHSKLENTDNELKSHSNSYEALLIVTLCEYLVSQGHETSSITILTTYVGQLYLIQQNMQGKKNLKGVLATTVDNYQGEENDIILVSFVRSNTANKVGFIKTHNRLCVALSRARKGLYCVGNFIMFASQSKIWQSLIAKLTDMECVGEKLEINCYNHPEKKYFVSTPTDLQKHKRKGCSEPCNEWLYCGHKCDSFCHSDEIQHSSGQCNQRCREETLLCERESIEITGLKKPCDSDTVYIGDRFQSDVFYVSKQSSNSLDIANNSPQNVIEPRENSPCITNELSTDFLHDSTQPFANPRHVANEPTTNFLYDINEKSTDLLCTSSPLPIGSFHDATKPPAYSHHVANEDVNLGHTENELPTNYLHNLKDPLVNSLHNADELPTDLLHVQNKSIAGPLNEPDTDLVNKDLIDLCCTAAISSANSLHSTNELAVSLLHDTNESPADLHDKNEPIANSLPVTNELLTDSLHVAKEISSDSSYNGSVEDINHSAPFQNAAEFDDNTSNTEIRDTTEHICDIKVAIQLNKSHQKKRVIIMPCGHERMLNSNAIFSELQKAKCEEIVTSQMQCGEIINHVCGDEASHENCSSPFLLQCGHTAPCNTNLDLYVCLENVRKPLQCGHHTIVSCHKSEYQIRRKCIERIERTLPCGHSMLVPCHASKFKGLICKVETEVTLLCGHNLLLPCHKSRMKKFRKCTVEVKHTFPCGHNIVLSCHKFNLMKSPTCKVEVQRTLACAHSVVIPCHEARIRKIMRCKVEVQHTFPCGHNVSMSCYDSKYGFGLCNVDVTISLPCGHSLVLPCQNSKQKGIKCFKTVKTTLLCGHTVLVSCHTSEDEVIVCNKIIKITLPCGHDMSTPCHMSEDENVTCVKMVKVTLPCNHDISVLCYKSKYGDLKCMVEVTVTLPCSHLCKVPCCNKDSLDAIRCQDRCGFPLRCHHNCWGICSECSSSGKHAICLAPVERPLPCGHVFETKCNTPFTFCRQRCMYRCAHEQCFNPCYVACFPCKIPCAWNCEHYQCDKLCNELCDRPPCNEPCAKLNPSCGHPCSGFCGEPCPTLCYLCKGETTHKKEKLILLEDCGHCIPHNELNNFLTNRKFQGCPNCPRCNVPITKNFHFGNILKTYYMSRNETNSEHIMNDFPISQFFQPYIFRFIHEGHVEIIWNELQMGKFLEHEIYISRMKVAHQLNVLFCINEVQKFLKTDSDSQKLYDSLRSNKESNDGIKAQIFKKGALLFIHSAISETQIFSKVGRVNEVCEDIMSFLEAPHFNNEMVEEIMESINSVYGLDCPNLSAFKTFLKELSWEIE